MHWTLSNDVQINNFNLKTIEALQLVKLNVDLDKPTIKVIE